MGHRDRDSRRADREKLKRLLVALGYKESGRSFYKLIQDRLGDEGISRSAAYRVYNEKPIVSSTRKIVEQALGVPFGTIELPEIQFKCRWSFFHPAFYSGPVWVQVQPKPENRRKAHRYSIRWGPWKFSSVLDFEGHQSASLLHMKGPDGESFPIFFEVSPACCIERGLGDPPAGPVHDINWGWTRLEGAASGSPPSQSLQQTGPP
jgi:hypothetical protein